MNHEMPQAGLPHPGLPQSGLPQSGANEPRVPLTQAPLEHAVFTPPIDIFESGDDLVLRADVPGVRLESVDVQVQDNKLTIFGRVGNLIPEKARILHQEFEVGDYLRSFILSDQVDHGRIMARLNQGLLEVVLPKAPKAAPRRIQVKED